MRHWNIETTPLENKRNLFALSLQIKLRLTFRLFVSIYHLSVYYFEWLHSIFRVSSKFYNRVLQVKICHWDWNLRTHVVIKQFLTNVIHKHWFESCFSILKILFLSGMFSFHSASPFSERTNESCWCYNISLLIFFSCLLMTRFDFDKTIG